MISFYSASAGSYATYEEGMDRQQFFFSSEGPVARAEAKSICGKVGGYLVYIPDHNTNTWVIGKERMNTFGLLINYLFK